MPRRIEALISHSASLANESPSEPERDPKSGPYLIAGLFLFALCLTLVAATRVEAGGWLGFGAEEGDHRERVGWYVDFMVERMLDRVDASDAQRSAIEEIVADTLDDLVSMREEKTESRQRLAALLTAETVDPEALERFRRERMAQAEIASQRLTEAVAAIAAELSPDQRTQLADHIERHRGHRRHAWRRP